jgi:hypothetical protein
VATVAALIHACPVLGTGGLGCVRGGDGAVVDGERTHSSVKQMRAAGPNSVWHMRSISYLLAPLCGVAYGAVVPLVNPTNRYPVTGSGVFDPDTCCPFTTVTGKPMSIPTDFDGNSRAEQIAAAKRMRAAVKVIMIRLVLLFIFFLLSQMSYGEVEATRPR